MKNIPILILHGWNLSADKYLPLQKELEKRKFVVRSIDLPGFGKERIYDKVYTMHDYADFVINYFKKNNINKVIIIGHSFGGRIGIYLSVNYSNMIKALILSGTPGLGSDLTNKENIYLFLAKVGKIIFSVPLISIFSDLARKSLYKMVGSYDYYNTKGTLRETFQNIVNFRLQPILNKINIPTLIIWGQEDRVVPVKIAYGMNKQIKDSKLTVIDEAKHGIPWTHPKAFAEEVEKFLESVE